MLFLPPRSCRRERISMLAGLALAAVLAGAEACTSISDVQAPSCTYAIAPMTATFDRSGGDGSVNVDASGVCGWSVKTSADWVSIKSGDSGQGAGSVKDAVATNAST